MVRLGVVVASPSFRSDRGDGSIADGDGLFPGRVAGCAALLQLSRLRRVANRLLEFDITRKMISIQ